MKEQSSLVPKGFDMSYEFYILMVLAYLVMIAVSACVSYGAGERGNDGSQDMPFLSVFSTLVAIGIASTILILDTDITERTFGFKVFLWLGAMLVAASISAWARKAGYEEYKIKHPHLM